MNPTSNEHVNEEDMIHGDAASQAEPAAPVDSLDADAPASIAQLQAAADEFNAAFTTALYELDKARQLAEKRAARIAELDASITVLNDSHAEAMRRSHQSDEAKARQIEELTGKVGELASELDASRDEHMRASEAFSHEREQLNAQMAKLQEIYNETCTRIDDVTREYETSRSQLEASTLTIEKLKAELSDLQESSDKTARELHARLEQNESLLRERDERLADLSGEFSALKTTSEELLANRTKLESLNRALHESSISENSIHQKLLEEKESVIQTLRRRLEESAGHAAGAETGVEHDSLKAELESAHASLSSAEAEIASLHGRVVKAGELEARLRDMSGELDRARADAAVRPELESTVSTLREQLASLQASLQASETERDALALRLSEHENSNEEMITSGVEFPSGYEVQPATQQPGASDETGEVAVDHGHELPAITSAQDKENEAPAEELDLDAIGGGNDENSEAPALELDLDAVGAKGDENSEAPALELDLDAIGGKVEENSEAPAEELDLVAIGGEITAGQDQSHADGLLPEVAGMPEIALADADDAVSAEQVIPVDEPQDVDAPVTGSDAMAGGVEDPANEGSGEVAADSGGDAGTIRDYLSGNNIRLYYQSIASLHQDDEECIEVFAGAGDEATGIVSHEEIIERAEREGMADAVDRYVIENAFRNMPAIEKDTAKLFIRLSAQSVRDQEFAMWLLGKIKEFRMKAANLVFELDERLLQTELKNFSMLSRALHSMGCGIVVDDYRMSSDPGDLNHVDVDYLKIDAKLISNLTGENDEGELAGRIMELARARNLLTIAKHVNTPDMLASLWELGVSMAQGDFVQAPTTNAEMDNDGPCYDDSIMVNGKAVFTHG